MSISVTARVDALFKKLQGRTNRGLNTEISNELVSVSRFYTSQVGMLPVPNPKPADLTPYPWIVSRAGITYNTSIATTSEYRAYSDSRVTNIIPYYPITVTMPGATPIILTADQYILDFDSGIIVIYTTLVGAPTISCFVYSGATYDPSRLLASNSTATGLFVDASGSVGVGVASVGNDTAGNRFGLDVSGSSRIGTAGTTRFLVDASGSVGVGMAAVGTDSQFTPTNYTIDPSGSSFAVTVPSSSAAIKYAADISGNTHIAGNLLVRTLAFEESTFTVSGDIETFYPIVFVLPTVSNIPGPFNFTVFRTTNMNAQSRGGMMINVEGHPIYYGHNFPYLSWKFENTIQGGVTYKYFVGNVELAEQNPAVILYLRGGQTSYKYYGTGIRAVLNATEVKSPLKLPEFTNTFTSKTTSEVTTSYFDFTRASGWYDSRCAMRSISYEGSGSNAGTISTVGTYIGGTSGARSSDISSVLRFATVKGDSNFIQSGQNTTSGSSLPLKITTMSAGKTAMMVDPGAGYTYVSDRMKIGSVVNGPSKTLDVAGDAVISNGILVTGGGLNITGTTELAGATTVSSGDLKANANAYVGSKLKIGSTSSVPAQALDVVGNATISGNLILNTLGNYSSPNIYWSGNATTGIYSMGTGVAMRSSAGPVAYVNTSGFQVEGGGLTVTTGGANITGQVNFNGTAPKGYPADITGTTGIVSTGTNGTITIPASILSASGAGLYWVGFYDSSHKDFSIGMMGYSNGTQFIAGGAHASGSNYPGGFINITVDGSATSIVIRNGSGYSLNYTYYFKRITGA